MSLLAVVIQSVPADAVSLRGLSVTVGVGANED